MLTSGVRYHFMSILKRLSLNCFSCWYSLEEKLPGQRLWMFLRLFTYFPKALPGMVLTIHSPTGGTRNSFLAASKLWVGRMCILKLESQCGHFNFHDLIINGSLNSHLVVEYPSLVTRASLSMSVSSGKCLSSLLF